MKYWFPIAAGGVIFGAMVALEVSAWQECRALFSWFYCFRTLSH